MFMLTVLTAEAQTTIHGTVVDNATKEPIVGANIRQKNNKHVLAVTNINGQFTVKLKNNQPLVISYVGYNTLVSKPRNGTFRLSSSLFKVNEVVVTATESGLTATSHIGREAIDLLQPSSFTDILELLPGGRAKDPVLGKPNTIRLREAPGGESTNYATSSLGTSFVVDGAPVSTNANMQYISGGGGDSFVNQGVDMRSISTDEIQNVEIVRGIPSVEYGDLTSGLVKIERKRGGNNISARLKADMGSHLFYIGKAFEWQNQLTLNLSADYLNSHTDPRNTLENYKRITLSARLGKTWNRKKTHMTFGLNLDYTGSFDDDKIDPDLNEGQVDIYRSRYNRYAVSTTWKLRMKNQRSWFKTALATLSSSYDYDEMSREKLIQLRRATIAATSLKPGESDAAILPYTYTAYHKAEGKPFNFFAKANAKFQVPSRAISNTLLLGVDWNVDKNYGRGQIFDMTRPLNPGMSGRPRDLSTIPAHSMLSMYAEENLRTSFWGNTLEVKAGLRGEQQMNLAKHYAMHGKTYWDPRVNLGWTFPEFKVFGKTSFIRLAGGWGQHTKFPTIEQTYPEPNYLDLVQLNFYHPNEAYKRIYIRTYVIDPTNFDLHPARNKKWEVNLDVSVGGNHLSVTYFRENMTSGFRSMPIYAPYAYKVYDPSGVDIEHITAPPSLDGMPYVEKNELLSYYHYYNGSQTKKEGLEYTLSTERIESIHTRLTINGAYFRSTFRNSQATQDRPVEVIGDEQIPFVGIYQDVEGSVNEYFNTNFTFDTNVPRLKIGFSVSSQWLWFTTYQRMPLSEEPNEYMDRNGDIHPWTSDLKEDFQLRYLVRNFTESMYKKMRIPASMNLNFKVKKKLFNDKLMVAMFCNKIWDYNPKYTRDDIVIRRHVTPYFGLEMNVKL